MKNENIFSSFFLLNRCGCVVLNPLLPVTCRMICTSDITEAMDRPKKTPLI